MSRVCAECGSDTYKSESYDRLIRQRQRMEREHERLASENGLLRANATLAAIEARDERAGLQGKVARQARAIRRLEKRVRELGAKPHQDVPPWDTAPVEQL